MAKPEILLSGLGRRVLAGGLAPDGITVDAEGAVWVQASGSCVVRVTEGGKIRRPPVTAGSRSR